jgi:alpha-L-rhamnosidase
VGDLTWVNCWYDSPYGKIISKWKREGLNLDWEIIVPPNTTGTVFVPTVNHQTIQESGRSMSQVKRVTFLRIEKGFSVYSVKAGHYRFASKLPAAAEKKTML